MAHPLKDLGKVFFYFPQNAQSYIPYGTFLKIPVRHRTGIFRVSQGRLYTSMAPSTWRTSPEI